MKSDCLLTTAILLAASSCLAAEPDAMEALHVGLTAKIGHARKWLDEGDFKSLSQSAGGLQLLIEVLRSQSDDAAWQEAISKLSDASKELQTAAVTGDPALCRAKLDALQMATAAAENVAPVGNRLSSPRATILPLMLLIDGVYADAKIAVLTGRAGDAKKHAYVLAELGRVVSNAPSSGRTAEKWSELSSGFVEEALAAARSPAEDTQAVRQLLRAVSKRCDACHDTR
jgi:hypothetical protein